MQAAATAWNFAPADNNRLTDLLKLFGCPDAIASVDVNAFGRRSAELIRQAISPQTAPVQSAVRPGRRVAVVVTGGDWAVHDTRCGGVNVCERGCCRHTTGAIFPFK
jgi:hypothetical protein